MKSILADNNIKVSAAFTLLIVSFCLTGCQKEDSTSFTATTQSYEAPKLHIGSNIAYWDNNDRVAINDGTYAVSIDGNDNKATIAAEGVTPYGNEYYAAYPAEYATISGSSVTFNVPYSESYTTNGSGHQLVNNIMVGKTNNSHLGFENVGAMLHFQLKGNSYGIDKTLLAIEVSCDQPLCGNLTVDMSGNTISSTITGSPSDTARILTFDTPYVLAADAKDFYLNIPAVTGATKFRVRYIFNYGGSLRIYEKTKSGTITFEKGKLYHFGEDIYNGSSVSFNGISGTSITPGSGDNPLRITSDDFFAATASAFGQTGRQFILEKDITVSNSIQNLKSTFDGNGHTITLDNNITLFQNIEGGTIKNLAITGDISNPTCYDFRYGTFACKVTGNSTIENCVNRANIMCYQGMQHGKNTSVGGICAFISGGTIKGCRNEGTITCDAQYTGGIAGNSSSMLYVEGCYNCATINVTIASGEDDQIFVGGIIGNLPLSSSGTLKVENCQNNGSIVINNSTSGTLCCGGCFGQVSSISGFSIENCSNTSQGSISCTTSSGAMYFGGIIGSDEGNNGSTMINCYNEGNIESSAIRFAGGLLGRSRKMSIINCFAYCDITANNVAGLVANGLSLIIPVSISNSYYYGTITSNGNNNKFGIAGESASSSFQMNLDHCYYPSDITTICGTNTNADNTCGTMSSATDNTTLNNLNSEANSHPDYNHWTTGYNGLESLHIIFQN